MTKKTKKDDDKKYIPDDRICIFYVADRIYDLEHIKNHKELQKEITEFKEELLQNIGIDVMIKRQANIINKRKGNNEINNRTDR